MESFLLGCNYWASNAGTEMWRQFDPQAIAADLQALREGGLTVLRVFPIWRDFQPLVPLMTAGGGVVEYRLEGDRPAENPYGLDPEMLARFDWFCDLCDRAGMKLIVGLVTGWMSGRLFLPQALYGRNLLTDPAALLLEQKLIYGFIGAFRHRKTVLAWDIGNECACMAPVSDRMAAENWTCTMAGAVRAADSTRPVISGIHMLEPDNAAVWSIAGQAQWNDVLVCHPYPYWSRIAEKDAVASYRTALHTAYMARVYADIGGKPCLTEEIGTMGPMICSDARSADFLRCGLLTSWAAGSLGLLWWCASDQTALRSAPYRWNMCELELGLLRRDGSPKPVLAEYRKFAAFLEQAPRLSPARRDAVCLLTQQQDALVVGFMAECLARQADLNLRFAFAADPLPEAEVYLMPSVTNHWIMPGDCYDRLRERIRAGATLYLSNDCGILSEFEDLTGLRVEDSVNMPETDAITLNGTELPLRRKRLCIVTPVDPALTVLARDRRGIPSVTSHPYGKGTVLYVNFPAEAMLLDQPDAFAGNTFLLYRLLDKARQGRRVTTEKRWVSLTEHPEDGGCWCVAVNLSDRPQNPVLHLADGWRVDELRRGDLACLPPYDGAVFHLSGT